MANTHSDHPAHLQHHFVSSEQQFDAAKMGMWLFLVTEILLFSGMFVAYTVYRSWHPEVFVLSSELLNPWLGGLNTIVLLGFITQGSLGMPWVIKNWDSGSFMSPRTPAPLFAHAAGALRFSREAKLREALKEARNGDAAFHAGERKADAQMRTTGKGQVLVGLAAKVQPVRISKLARIAVGSANGQMNARSGWDQLAMELRVHRAAAVAQLVGRLKAQELIHGGVDQLRG